MHLTIQNIQSPVSGDFQAQIDACFRQIEHQSEDEETTRRLVKITVFTSCIDNTDYLQKMNLLNNALVQFEECQAPVSLVSQPPVDCGTIMEVWLLEHKKSECTFSFTRVAQSATLVIECPAFSCLFTSHFSAKHDTFSENTHETFWNLNDTLQKSGFDYSHIVRQWNYIENIVYSDTSDEKPHQNYQLFNDLRSHYYAASDFKNGYPSATGIGISNGGCTIEVIALKEKKIESVKPLTNSLQVDAHNYSSNVLVTNVVDEIKIATTPKFERGKYMKLDKTGFLFISGTASIIGERTVFPDDVAKQALTTILNIEHLVSTNNLNINNIDIEVQPAILNYRVYLKNESDYPVVKSVCEAHFGIKNGFFVKADICRDNLLVEIEANYSV